MTPCCAVRLYSGVPAIQSTRLGQDLKLALDYRGEFLLS